MVYGSTDDPHTAMLGGHNTLNTVVLGEGMSKYQILPHFGHHWRSCRTSVMAAEATSGSASVDVAADPGSEQLVHPLLCVRPAAAAGAGRCLAVVAGGGGGGVGAGVQLLDEAPLVSITIGGDACDACFALGLAVAAAARRVHL